MKYINIIEKNLKIDAKKKYLPLQKGDIKSTLSNISSLKKLVINQKLIQSTELENL